MRLLAASILISVSAGAFAAGPQSLKLTISTESATVSEPYALPLTLHFLNTGIQTIWLYRPVRAARPADEAKDLTPDVEQTAPRPTGGGSTLEVNLTSPGAATKTAHPTATVMVPAEAWQPKLIRLAPGEKSEEYILIHVASTEVAGQKGTSAQVYKLKVIYRAWYSNLDEIERVAGVNLWHAEAESNAIAISLLPTEGTGEISGTITGSDGGPAAGILVSLSDREERMTGQMVTNFSGQYEFRELPWGFYWVTARPSESVAARDIIQHAVLTAHSPSASADLMMLPFTAYEPKQLLHKPILVRIDDSQGHPESRVKLQSTFSNGSVVENIKAQTPSDGVAELEVIPGSNFLTLEKKGCPKEDRRMNVASGGGVDAFRFTLACSKK